MAAEVPVPSDVICPFRNGTIPRGPITNRTSIKDISFHAEPVNPDAKGPRDWNVEMQCNVAGCGLYLQAVLNHQPDASNAIRNAANYFVGQCAKREYQNNQR